MEFLKSCTTNIHVLENVSEISCLVYRGKGGTLWDGERWKLMRKALLELRKRNVLCVKSRHRIWVFGTDPWKVAEVLDSEDFELDDPATLDAVTSDRTLTEGSTRDFFLQAVEAAIAYKLAPQDGMRRCGPWTWIISQDIEGDSAAHNAVLLRLRANLSSSGNMYLASDTTTLTLIPPGCPRYKESDYVMISPQGVLAQLVSQEQRSPAGDDSSRSYIRSYLETEGINVAEDAQWNTVKPGKDIQNPSLLWPADLCLVLEADAGEDFSGGSDAPRWQSWFEGSAETSFKNPLMVAEEWFRDAARRGQATEELNQAEGNVNMSTDSNRQYAGNGDNNESESHTTMPSPFAQRNSEQQLAMAGIYPTPPDGLTQATGNTQLSTDNISSSVQADHVNSSMDLSMGDDMLQPHGRDSIGSAFQQDYNLQTDDLFGDTAEEMELGDNAVDDADFSFFDEPDEDRNVTDVDDTNMLEVTNVERVPDTQKIQEDIAGEPVAGDESKTPVHGVDDAKDEDISAQPYNDHLDQPQDEIGDNRPHTQSIPVVNVSHKPEKPLSPFGIRERLLPPPVPASVAQTDPVSSQERRRSSCFAPVKFREGFNLASKYAISDLSMKAYHDDNALQNSPNIGLPRRKKHRPFKQGLRHQHEPSDDDSDSEEDSYESSSQSEKETELPPKLPWETRKRKRHPDVDPGTPLSAVHEHPVSDTGPDDGYIIATPDHNLLDTLESSSTHSHYLNDLRLCKRKFLHGSFPYSAVKPNSAIGMDQLPYIEDIFDLSKLDLIYIAQIVSEQSVSVLLTPTQSPETSRVPLIESSGITAPIRASVDEQLSSIFPAMEKCDLSHVALYREPLSRQMSSGKPQPGQPRPPQRSDSMVAGPDYFTIPPSYVRVQRGVDNWEMLPTCLSFWESLGLGPAGGPKNIAAFCILPSNESLRQLVEQFMIDLGAAYENCKLGTHLHGRRGNGDGKSGKSDHYDTGMASVELDDGATLEGTLRAYASTCISLGKALGHVGQLESDRNIVVYMLHPFTGQRATQLLCACFWMLFKAYRDSMAKLHRSQGCDVVLQILPIQSVTSFDALVTHQAKDMAMLAREVYDRCPPSPTRAPVTASALPILVAPSVSLASPAPKKIGFQLCIDPPSDLLHEGSILHLAYATSADGQWLTAVWIDNIGLHFATVSYCLCGRSFAEIAADVWERTREILAARRVMWRIFIVTTEKMNRSVFLCWRALCAKPRGQPLWVTLLAAQVDPTLQLMPPSLANESLNAVTTQDSNLFTPVSTPQAATFTNSPDVSGHTNAPPTPAPSETTAAVVENDPDAHLTDLTDDAWAMLLSPKLSALLATPGLANGILLKRGDDDGATGNLPSLGVSILWTIQVKPNGGVDEGALRHCELTLREVLRIYRHLAILTKARGLDDGRAAAVPLHIAAALCGVTHLDGMLSPS